MTEGAILMGRLITQSVVLPGPGRESVRDISRSGPACSGYRRTVGAQSGAAISCFLWPNQRHDALYGRAKADRQSWRSTNLRDGDPDSTLILAFAPEGKDGRIDSAGNSVWPIVQHYLATRQHYVANPSPHRPDAKKASHLTAKVIWYAHRSPRGLSLLPKPGVTVEVLLHKLLNIGIRTAAMLGRGALNLRLNLGCEMDLHRL